MIGFRQVDARYPFLWESRAQPAGRWHGAGEGPAHYLADTPDGAWAEFLRHEEITDPADLGTIRRQMWVVEFPDGPLERVGVPHAVATGDPDTYLRCQAEARKLRARGVERLVAPSAALVAGGARTYAVGASGSRMTSRDGVVFVLYGPPDLLTGRLAADAARPAADLLERVHHFDPS